MNAVSREKLARVSTIAPLDLVITQAVRTLRDAWRALDTHDRASPSVSSVSAAQVRAKARVQLVRRLTSARSGLDCLLRGDA